LKWTSPGVVFISSCLFSCSTVTKFAR
jgi:hypothetical protein